MTQLEKIARAMLESKGWDEYGCWTDNVNEADLSCVIVDGNVNLFEVARAAVEAMRDPGDGLLAQLARICADERGNLDETQARTTLELFIDAILNEKG
jgi:hypothetical protein